MCLYGSAKDQYLGLCRSGTNLTWFIHSKILIYFTHIFCFLVSVCLVWTGDRFKIQTVSSVFLWCLCFRSVCPLPSSLPALLSCHLVQLPTVKSLPSNLRSREGCWEGWRQRTERQHAFRPQWVAQKEYSRDRSRRRQAGVGGTVNYKRRFWESSIWGHPWSAWRTQDPRKAWFSGRESSQ